MGERTKLPEVKWTPVFIPNPDRRWWQFRKPRLILNPDLPPLFGHDDIFDGIPWKRVEEIA